MASSADGHHCYGYTTEGSLFIFETESGDLKSILRLDKISDFKGMKCLENGAGLLLYGGRQVTRLV